MWTRGNMRNHSSFPKFLSRRLRNFLFDIQQQNRSYNQQIERNRCPGLRVDRVWTAVELAKHALEADPTRVSKLGRCYETEPATVLRAGTGVRV
ncbi:unnamed protein product [Cochlearia groenlandica]